MHPAFIDGISPSDTSDFIKFFVIAVSGSLFLISMYACSMVRIYIIFSPFWRHVSISRNRPYLYLSAVFAAYPYMACPVHLLTAINTYTADHIHTTPRDRKINIPATGSMIFSINFSGFHLYRFIVLFLLY